MLKVKEFTFSPFQENTYVVSNEDGECFIIDPGCYDRKEKKMLQAYIAKEGLRPVALLNTHCHVDHVFGNAFVSDTYKLHPKIHELEVPVLNAVARVAEMYGLEYDASPKPEILQEKKINLGHEKFDILFVPGHSPGHIAFYNEKQKMIFSGDVLFRKSIGRTDLPGGDTDTLINSIRKVMFELPDDTTVYAGHMEPTTIGFEKKNNPFLK